MILWLLLMLCSLSEIPFPILSAEQTLTHTSKPSLKCEPHREMFLLFQKDVFSLFLILPQYDVHYLLNMLDHNSDLLLTHGLDVLIYKQTLINLHLTVRIIIFDGLEFSPLLSILLFLASRFWYIKLPPTWLSVMISWAFYRSS